MVAASGSEEITKKEDDIFKDAEFYKNFFEAVEKEIKILASKH